MPWYAWRLMVEPATRPRKVARWKRTVLRLVLEHRGRGQRADDLSDVAALRVYNEMSALAVRYAQSLADEALCDAFMPRMANTSAALEDEVREPG